MKSDVQAFGNSPAATVDGKTRPAARHHGEAAQSNGAAIPWQERPAGCARCMWRHAANPIIGRHHLPGVQGIYNSAVAPFGDGFVGVFRLEKTDRFPHLHVGWSDDGLDWHIEPKPIHFASGDPGLASDYAYDPRRLQNRSDVLHHLVRRALRADDQRRRDEGLSALRSARERVPSVQSQRRAFPAENQREILHAQPAERQRPHALSATST